MYRFIRCTVGACLSVLLLFSVTVLAEQPQILRLASWGPPQHYLSKSRTAWIDAVNERAGGRIKIIDYPGGQLYGPKDMHRAVSRGLIDMGVILQPRLMATVPLLQGVYLPFAFDSMEQAAEAYSGESLAIIDQAMREKNLQLIYPSFSGGVDIFSSRGLIKTPDDMKNLRILATSPMFTDLLLRLQAAPDTSIAQSEQYMALKRGVADATINGIVTGYFQRNHEVAPYVTKSNMSFPTVLLTVNLDVWNALPEDIRDIMMEEGEKQKAYSLAASAAMEARFTNALAEQGAIFKTMPAATRQQIQSVSSDVWQAWAEQNGPQAQRLLELNLPQPDQAME